MLPEMEDFMVAPVNHTTILVSTRVRRQILHFLQNGRICRAGMTCFSEHQ